MRYRLIAPARSPDPAPGGGFGPGQAERAGAASPQQLGAQFVALFDGAIVQAAAGTPLDPGTLQAAVRALLDAEARG